MLCFLWRPVLGVWSRRFVVLHRNIQVWLVSRHSDTTDQYGHAMSNCYRALYIVVVPEINARRPSTKVYEVSMVRLRMVATNRSPC